MSASPTVYVDSFETLQVLRSWSHIVHIVGYNPQIFLSLYLQNERRQFFAAKVNRYCMHLLLQFNADCIETLQVFRSWSKDVTVTFFAK